MAPVCRDDALIVAAAVVPLAILLVRESRIAGGTGFPLDDAWIHLHFARNIADGAGFSYNPGTPVAGSTAPLWTLIVAAGVALFGPSLALLKTLGAAGAVGAAVLTRRAAVAWGVSPGVGLTAAVALLWTGPIAWAALSGMEVSLAALLVAAALLAHARASTVWTAAFAGLAALARPEALVVAALLAIAGPRTVRRVVTFAAIVTIVLAPAVWFSLSTVGSPLPATAAAKVEGGLLGWAAGKPEPLTRLFLVRPWEYVRVWTGWLSATHWLLPIAAALGLLMAWRRRRRDLGVVALAVLAHPVAMAVVAPYREPSFQEGRYSTHVLPLVALLIALSLDAVRPRWRGVVCVGYLALALLPLGPAAERYAWGVQNINAMQVHLGRWVDANLPPSARIAVNDIGAIAYFSRRPIVDLMGLVTPEIIPYRRDGEGGILRYLIEQCPDFVIVFPAWFPRLTRDEGLEAIYRVRLDRNEVAGAAETVVYRLTRCAA